MKAKHSLLAISLLMLIFAAACGDSKEAAEQINSAAITVTAPVPNRPPVMAATGSGGFSVASVSWMPNHHTFMVFETYTVSVTLEADEGYFFAANLSAAINEQGAKVTGGGSTVTLVFQFPVIQDSKNIGMDGTSAKPFKVYDEGTLKRVGRDSDALAWSLSACYEQIDDIVLPPVTAGESNWIAIGSYSNSASDSFKGTYDGRGHTISNLTINANDNKHQGMFAYITGGTVKNTGLVNGSINGRGKSGGIAGEIGNAGKLENCYFTGNVTGGNYSGGIVGDNNSLSTIENCYTTAIVTSVINHTNTAGGIVGANSGTVKNCVALNNSVISGSNDVGRIAGENSGGQLTNNYARNDMVLKYGGYGDDKSPVGDAVNHVDGESIDAAQYNNENWWAVVNWDFTTIWEWDSSAALPVLRK